jgi:hypothetical protein
VYEAPARALGKTSYSPPSTISSDELGSSAGSIDLAVPPMAPQRCDDENEVLGALPRSASPMRRPELVRQ